MSKKEMMGWIGGLLGLLCLTATAETYPAPEKEKMAAVELRKEQGVLSGKVVEVKFNRIALIHRVKDGLYAGNLRSKVKAESDGDWDFFSDDPGIDVEFPAEGLTLFSKFLPTVGAGRNFVADVGNDDDGAVYVLIGSSSVALGDRYKDGEYSWSKKAKIPDLADAKKISVADVLLYPDQLDGKTIELQFYYATNLRKGSSACTVSVSDGFGGSHSRLSLDFPPEGMEFFQEAEGQDSGGLTVRKVFAKVELSSSGKVSVTALGKRRQGKGDDTTYKW